MCEHYCFRFSFKTGCYVTAFLLSAFEITFILITFFYFIFMPQPPDADVHLSVSMFQGFFTSGEHYPQLAYWAHKGVFFGWDVAVVAINAILLICNGCLIYATARDSIRPLQCWIVIELIVSGLTCCIFFLYQFCVVAIEYYVKNLGLAISLTILYPLWYVFQFHGIGTAVCHMKELRIEQALERSLARREAK